MTSHCADPGVIAAANFRDSSVTAARFSASVGSFCIGRAVSSQGGQGEQGVEWWKIKYFLPDLPGLPVNFFARSAGNPCHLQSRSRQTPAGTDCPCSEARGEC